MRAGLPGLPSLFVLLALASPAVAQSFAPITVVKSRNPAYGQIIRITPKVGSVDVRVIIVDRGRCRAVSAALMGNEGVLSTKMPFQLGFNRWVKVEVFGVTCPAHEVQIETGSGRWEFRLD